MKVQSRIKGLIFRKKIYVGTRKVKAGFIPNDSYMRFNTIPNNKVTDLQIRELFEKYPKLNDGIEVRLKESSATEYDNKSIYFGERRLDNNQRHGRGIHMWIDGSRYEGYWVNDKANIRGKLFHADGDTYEGEWSDDKAHGKGVYTHTDGAKYEGDWKDDKQDGFGKETWPDSAYYEGEYKQGKKSGHGIFRWNDGSMYEGFFFNNNINGKGNNFIYFRNIHMATR